MTKPSRIGLLAFAAVLGTSSVAAADYIGCFTDDENRALPVNLGYGYTVDSCIATMRDLGYPYAGVQYYGHCFGGSSAGYAQVGDGECDTPCDGNPSQMCGGAWRNSIYSTGAGGGGGEPPQQPPTSSPPSNGPGYVGCFTDSEDRALPVLLGTDQTVDSCINAAAAAGYPYAGLQYYGYCFAGAVARFGQVSDGECDTPCNANSSQWCGGVWRNSIYATGVQPPEEPPMPQCCSSYEYIPGRFTNTTPGDVVVSSSEGVVSGLVAQLGEQDTHVLMVESWNGQLVSQNAGWADRLDTDCFGPPIHEYTLGYMGPGIMLQQNVDYTRGLTDGIVLDNAGGACSGSGAYQLYSYTTDQWAGQCAHFLRDGCGVSMAPTAYDPGRVYAATDTTWNIIYAGCLDQFGFWGNAFASLFCGGGRESQCRDAANQVVNTMHWNATGDTNDYRQWWGHWVTDVVTPTQVMRSNPSARYQAAVEWGTYECRNWYPCTEYL